jgi:hypothetical protein
MKKITIIIISLVLACTTLAGMSREEILKYNESILKTNTPEGQRAIAEDAARLAQSQREHGLTSPYAGGLVKGTAKNGAHFMIIEHKTGSGCVDAALLFISYDGVKLVCPSIFDAKVWPRIQSKEYDHFGVTFDRWDIDNGKLYLIAYARGGGNYEWQVSYDLRRNTVAVGPRTTEHRQVYP